MPARTAEKTNDPELVRLDPVAEEARPALGVADGANHAAGARRRRSRGTPDSSPRGRDGRRRRSSTTRVPSVVQVEAEEVLEVGEAVVAAEAHVVAEERQHQRVAERLRDDREVDARHARPEREPAEHQREQRRHEHHHQHREPEVVEPVPEPRQPLPVQEHHEVGQHRIAVDAARADLPHQVHAHRVAAEREERRVAEAEDAAVAPDEIDGQREHRVAQVLADERQRRTVER